MRILLTPSPPRSAPVCQLVHQVEHALRLGYLEPGDQLPRVRDVVAGLTINPNTVLKAYRELGNKGPALPAGPGHQQPRRRQQRSLQRQGSVGAEHVVDRTRRQAR
jgi:DNA-binding transcriptional MocR family regulator